MILAVLIPRFELLAACSERWEVLREPVVLAPEPGRSQRVGQASRAAEAHGVRAGMRLGEALARCPEITVLTPDPERAGQLWEEIAGRVKGIGAALAPSRA
ncbi:MAG TPA: hypothetical protein VFC52_04430, partial [Solirubrobacterales bacterium]|nr:hypothetical protein [Solirubrobacterales bacterium]